MQKIEDLKQIRFQDGQKCFAHSSQKNAFKYSWTTISSWHVKNNVYKSIFSHIKLICSPTIKNNFYFHENCQRISSVFKVLPKKMSHRNQTLACDTTNLYRNNAFRFKDAELNNCLQEKYHQLSENVLYYQIYFPSKVSEKSDLTLFLVCHWSDSSSYNLYEL